MKSLLLLFTLVLFVSCADHNSEKQLKTELSRQIATMVKAASDTSTCIGKQKPLIDFISENCNRLLLLSRDLENSGTTLLEANRFFFETVTLNVLNKSGLQQLTEKMAPEKRSIVILQNELWLLNASTQACGGAELPLHAAQEE